MFSVHVSANAIGAERLRELRTYTALRQSTDDAEVLSQTQAREKRGSKKEELHCDCAWDVDLT